jgi:hypothetical protein
MNANVLSTVFVAGVLAASVWVTGVETPSHSTAPTTPVPGLGEAAITQEGYFVQDGVAYAVRGGKSMRVLREVSLRVTPAGIIGFDGAKVNLPPGQMITNDGRLVPIPAGLTPKGVVPVDPGATDPAATPPATDRVRPNSVAPPVERGEPPHFPSPTTPLPTPSTPKQ